MLYAILAYHVEEDVTSLTPDEDAALMIDLNRIHDRLLQEGRMGPAAQLPGDQGRLRITRPGQRRCRRRTIYRDQGTAPRFLRHRLRRPRSRDRCRARPAPGQSRRHV